MIEKKTLLADKPGGIASFGRGRNIGGMVKEVPVIEVRVKLLGIRLLVRYDKVRNGKVEYGKARYDIL